ncbi:SPOR domain-containing protein [Maribellus sediminis]|uniref:SPOR domain-containing protein n=1 Tax=Maribellus sediminis TaxID=2696285 RepID=UPI001431932E|nr:SPOR domain-containing protein [Maribellus sediminis]
MNYKRTRVLVTISFVLMFASISIFANEQDNTLVKAIKLFDQQQYKEAEILLKELLDKNPDHLMVNYFYGACRTENQQYGQKEITYLLKGSTGESPLKTDYYLGIQYQAQNRWEDAIRHYKIFQNQVSEDEQADLNLPEKIRQCEEHINPYTPYVEEETVIAPLPRPEEEQAKIDESASIRAGIVYAEAGNESTLVDSLAFDSITTDSIVQTDVIEETIPEKAKLERIDFTINGEMTYIDTSNFQTDEGLNNYLKWEKSASKLDSLKALMDSWRTSYAKANTTAQRDQLGNKIIAGESELFSLQKETREFNTLAIKAEDDYWSAQSESDRIAFSKQLQELARSYSKPEQRAEEPIDTTLIIPQEVAQTIPVATPANEENNQEGLVYKIQIGAYSRGLPAYVKKLFDKLSYIRKIENYTDDRGVVVYTTGNLTNYEDAVKMQNQVRQEGIEDAFVVPYFNGKRITLNEAKKLEQEK